MTTQVYVLDFDTSSEFIKQTYEKNPNKRVDLLVIASVLSKMRTGRALLVLPDKVVDDLERIYGNRALVLDSLIDACGFFPLSDNFTQEGATIKVCQLLGFVSSTVHIISEEPRMLEVAIKQGLSVVSINEALELSGIKIPKPAS